MPYLTIVRNIIFLIKLIYKIMAEKLRKSKLFWTPAADEAFIDLWEEKASELRGNRKNSHIYAEMAQSLKQFLGGIRPIDVKYKIHNFSMKYTKFKGTQGTGCSPASWKHYERVHRIIGNNRINNVDVVVMDSIKAKPAASPISKAKPVPAASPASTTRPVSAASPASTTRPVSSSPAVSLLSSPEPSSPALSEVSTPVTKSKNHKINELNETIKTAMAENNKLTADLIELEKKKVEAIETLSQSVISFLERN